MKESSTYQAIVEEGMGQGAVSEARKFLLRLAKKRLGAPPAEVLIAVDAIADVERLEELGELFMEVQSWDEALPMLTARPRRRRRS